MFKKITDTTVLTTDEMKKKYPDCYILYQYIKYGTGIVLAIATGQEEYQLGKMQEELLNEGIDTSIFYSNSSIIPTLWIVNKGDEKLENTYIAPYSDTPVTKEETMEMKEDMEKAVTEGNGFFNSLDDGEDEIFGGISNGKSEYDPLSDDPFKNGEMWEKANGFFPYDYDNVIRENNAGDVRLKSYKQVIDESKSVIKELELNKEYDWETIASTYPDMYAIITDVVEEDGRIIKCRLLEVVTYEQEGKAILAYRKQGIDFDCVRTTSKMPTLGIHIGET